MNFLETIETIKSKFKTEGFEEISKEIEEFQIALGTPGEVFMAITYYLNTIKNKKNKLYQVAKNEIDELLKWEI